MQELLIVFERILESNFEWHCDEIDKYSERLEADWHQFWKSRGDEIVKSTWCHQYSEYIVKEEKEEKLKEPDYEATLPKEDSNEDQSDITGSGWQELWNEHYATTYSTTYQTYSIVHSHQYYYYQPNIEDDFEELRFDSQDEFSFIEEREQLASLGLPTSFGGRQSQYHSSQMKPKLEIKQDQLIPLKKKKKNRKLRQIPEIILNDTSLRSYWYNRFSLFSRFDEGIKLDRESWFSVTPEKVAIHMAERLRCDTIIDAFCGSGGNAIQFALTCSKVIAIDIDPNKIKNAKHNANIYGVASKIDFIIGDYIQLCGALKGDVVFLSPPWGGPKYVSKKQYDIEESLAPIGASSLAQLSRQISNNIAFFLPRNSKQEQILKLAGVGNRVEVEHNFLDRRLVGLTAIYGDWLIDKKNVTD